MDETRLTTVLADLAGAADAPVTTMSVGRAITDGRRRIRHRRLAAATAGAVALITLAAAGLQLHIAPRHHQPLVTASSPALIYEGQTVRRIDGTVVAHLDVSSAAFIDQVVRVPSGWLIQLSFDWDGGNLWFQPDGGSARPFAEVGPSPPSGGGGVHFVVTGDGSTVVIDGPDRLTAYDLPSLHVRRTLERPGEQFYIEQHRGDAVLARDTRGAAPAGGVPVNALESLLVWNARTGATAPIPDLEGGTFGQTPAGATLYPGRLCYPDMPCTPATSVPPALDGWVAPAGSTIVFQMVELSALRVTGGAEGTATPQPFDDRLSTVDYWLDDTTFVASRGQLDVALVCHTTTLHCDEIDLHIHAAESGVVQVIGGG